VIRKLLFAAVAIVVIGLGGFFAFAPGYTERSMNVIDGKPLPMVSAEAIALHNSLVIVDLHSDSLMWNRDINDRATRGHMDLPRLQEGNVALQVFSSVTKTPKGQNYDANGADTDNITLLTVAQLQPMRTWSSLLERSLWHAAKLDQNVASSYQKLNKIADEKSLDGMLFMRSKGENRMGALLSIEGLHNLEGKAENLDKLYAAGFRMAGLTHFFDNELAGSMHGLKKGGLTPFGRDIIARMEAKGMIVDIAHCSQTCVTEVLSMARRPVVSSHGGVQATCKVNRNLSDDHIKGVAKTGGIIGIGYWDAAVCDISPKSIAAAMKHVRDLVGIEHVALGSDYDGATTVRFDTSHLVQVTQALLDAGFTEPEIRAAMGENAIRVLRDGIRPMGATSGAI
jgi:membrane dipeptidase